MRFHRCNRRCTFLEWKERTPGRGDRRPWCRKANQAVSIMKACPGKELKTTTAAVKRGEGT